MLSRVWRRFGVRALKSSPLFWLGEAGFCTDCCQLLSGGSGFAWGTYSWHMTESGCNAASRSVGTFWRCTRRVVFAGRGLGWLQNNTHANNESRRLGPRLFDSAAASLDKTEILHKSNGTAWLFFFFVGGQKQAAREFSTCLCQIKSWRSCQTKLGHEAHRDIRRGALSRLLVPTAADQRKCRLEKPACSLHTNFLSLVAVSPIGPLPAKTMSPSFIASPGRVARRPDPIMSSQDGRPRHTTGHVCSGFGKVGAVSFGSEESQSPFFCLTHWAKDTLAKLSN
jgi:hypothetical protein